MSSSTCINTWSAHGERIAHPLHKVKGEISLTEMASEPPPPLPSAEDIQAIRAVKDEELPWLPPRPDTDQGNRYINKAKENPFVPLGERMCFNSYNLAYK